MDAKQKQQLEQKARLMAGKAVGRPFEVKKANTNVSFGGTIIRCEFAGFNETDSAIKVVWQVWITGPDGSRTEKFYVNRIPQPVERRSR